MADVYLTQQGYDKLREELEYLKKEKRREISSMIKRAREFGDLSENAEYEAAKEAQALNEKKIAELEDKLSRARIIEDENISYDEVRIGAKVTLQDMDSGGELQYTIVSETEADYEEGKISLTSPVGKGLMGHKEGEVVEIEIPAGLLKYKILKISG
ncbi:MAG: transcription elongation factor GreA [Candidatus Omnitrophica bacterium 4484_171]|nr:MAG: transcription elongation factor GreA [Candidatus Omnitrophica bacterium 4484_171]